MDNFASLSAVELVRKCSSSNDPLAWKEFIKRFHKYVFCTILREWKSHKLDGNEKEVVSDLVQEVYIKLLGNDKRALRDFNAKDDTSVYAFISFVVRSVVLDFVRHQGKKKRAVNTISLEETVDLAGENATLGETLIADDIHENILIKRDLELMLKKVMTGSNATIDTIIFKLHAIDGLSASEIASIPKFQMTPANVDVVIRRTREKLRDLMPE